MSEFTKAEYQADIKIKVAEVVNAILKEETTLDEGTDKLHELVDGDQWIIYNFYDSVLAHTDNPNAVHDVYGEEIPAKNLDDMKLKYAFCAMYQDCVQLFEEVRDEVKDLMVAEENIEYYLEDPFVADCLEASLEEWDASMGCIVKALEPATVNYFGKTA